jgi:hypothetical protein
MFRNKQYVELHDLENVEAQVLGLGDVPQNGMVGTLLA